MLTISNLDINYVRNITQANLDLGERFNFFQGLNGSGKTSILEAIYMLSTGNSFRTKTAAKLIQKNSQKCTIVACMQGKNEPFINHVLGIEKSSDGSRLIKVDGSEISSVVELAKFLPLNLINSDSIFIIDGEAKFRRRFLDWCLFHVEQNFLPEWLDFTRILQQRNSFLRQIKENRGKIDFASLNIWDQKFIAAAQKIDNARNHLIGELHEIFTAIISTFFPKLEISLTYFPGWSSTMSLEEALIACRDKNCLLGFSTVGPHRADLETKIWEKPAKDILSRGQHKLLAAALFITRTLYLDKKNNKKSIFLIDDIQAELDSEACEKFMLTLQETKCQIIMTGVDTTNLFNQVPANLSSMFHVEHGKIKQQHF